MENWIKWKEFNARFLRILVKMANSKLEYQVGITKHWIFGFRIMSRDICFMCAHLILKQQFEWRRSSVIVLYNPNSKCHDSVGGNYRMWE